MEFHFNWDIATSPAPYITVNIHGIACNKRCADMLGNPEKVIVGYDKDRNIIGIREYDNKICSKPYLFNGRMVNGWIRIGCKGFVKYLSEMTKLQFDPAIQYPAKFDAESRTAYILLLDNHIKRKKYNKRKVVRKQGQTISQGYKCQ